MTIGNGNYGVGATCGNAE